MTYANLHWLAFAVAEHLWQCSLVVGVILVFILCLGGARAGLRHCLWLMALLKLLLPLAIVGPAVAAVVSALVSAEASIVVHPRVEGFLSPVLLEYAGGADRSWQDPLLLVFGCWFVGLLSISIVRWKRKQRTKKSLAASVVPDDDTARKLVAAIGDSGIPYGRITLTTGSEMPSVMGLFRPEIRVPVALVHKLRASEMRAILLHEYAHCLRRDPLLVGVSQVVASVYYFFPLVWLITHGLKATREMACDDYVLDRGIPSSTYLSALAITVSVCLDPAQGRVALRTSRSLFSRRIDRIESYSRGVTRKWHVLALAAGFVVVASGSLLPISHGIAMSSSDVRVAQDSKAEVIEESPDTYPILEKKNKPRYPEQARTQRVEGRVLLKALVRRDGSVGEIEVLHCTDPELGFEDAAVESVRDWHFAPATLAGQIVAVQHHIQIEFSLN